MFSNAPTTPYDNLECYHLISSYNAILLYQLNLRIYYAPSMYWLSSSLLSVMTLLIPV